MTTKKLLALSLAAGTAALFIYDDDAPVRAPKKVMRTAQPIAVKALQTRARGEVRVTADRATNGASMVRVGPGGDLAPHASGDPQAKVMAFFAEHGAVFGVSDAENEL